MANPNPPCSNGAVQVAAIYLELFGRIPPLVREAVVGLDLDTSLRRVDPDANPLAWLVWHLTRIQDHHVSEILEEDQVYVAGDWPERFGLEPDPDETGYGHTSEQVAQVRPESISVLVDYHDAVDTRTRSFLAGLTEGALERIVDRRFDPPVTLGVRLVSIADDSLQHLGQAAYVRGLLARD